MNAAAPCASVATPYWRRVKFGSRLELVTYAITCVGLSPACKRCSTRALLVDEKLAWVAAAPTFWMVEPMIETSRTHEAPATATSRERGSTTTSEKVLVSMVNSGVVEADPASSGSRARVARDRFSMATSFDRSLCPIDPGK